MKSFTKNAWFLLPALALMSLAGWWFLGALTRHGVTGDLLGWLAELPILTCYAIAALVAEPVRMHVSGMNLSNRDRAELTRRAAAGDRDAERVLHLETCCWFVWLLLSTLFFLPQW